MQLSFIFFILVSLVVILGSFYLKYNSNQPISAFILSIGFFIIAIIFGVQWFTLSGNAIGSSGSGPWPPTISVCPDFLSLSSDDSGNQFCIDTIGVSNPPSGTGLQVWSKTNNGPTSQFDLNLTVTPTVRIKNLCDQCKNYGLTWEGVWDGITCTGNQPPMPVSEI